VRFQQRKYQLAWGLGLEGLEGANRSELLLTVKITIQWKYLKARHTSCLGRGRHHAFKGQREARASPSIIFLETQLRNFAKLHSVSPPGSLPSAIAPTPALGADKPLCIDGTATGPAAAPSSLAASSPAHLSVAFLGDAEPAPSHATMLSPAQETDSAASPSRSSPPQSSEL